MFILIGPPSSEGVNISASICSASVVWSSSRREICGPINYDVQFINNNHVVRNLNTSTSEISNISLAPNTSYTIRIAAIDSAGKGTYKEDMFSTRVPTGMCKLLCTSRYDYCTKMKSLLFHGIVMRVTPVEFLPTGQP